MTAAPVRQLEPYAYLPFFLVAGWFIAKASSVPPFGPDEPAHFSYVLDAWKLGAIPMLEQLLIYDIENGGGILAESYLNHPPWYYLVMGLPSAVTELPWIPLLIALRIANAVATVGMVVLATRSIAKHQSPRTALVFAIIVSTCPLFLVQLGYVNNDTMAFMAGCLWLVAVNRSDEDWRERSTGLHLLLGALVLAFAAKLTAAILLSALTGIYGLFLLRARIVPRIDALAVVLAGVVGIVGLSYLVFLIQYGSPAPKTPGHIALMQIMAAELGRTEIRLGIFEFGAEFRDWFLLGWASNGHERVEAVLPILGIAVAIFALELIRGLFRGRSVRVTALPVAVLVAFLAHLVIHFGAAYERHLQTGWGTGGHMRYYFPLLPAFFAIVAGGIAHLRGPVLVLALAGWFALAAVHPISPLFEAERTQSDQS